MDASESADAAAGDGTGWEARYAKVMERLRAPKEEAPLCLGRKPPVGGGKGQKGPANKNGDFLQEKMEKWTFYRKRLRNGLELQNVTYIYRVWHTDTVKVGECNQ